MDEKPSPILDSDYPVSTQNLQKAAVHYDERVAFEICNRIAQGKSLLAVCLDPNMPCRETVLRWVREKPGFAERYRQARVDLVEFWADELVQIADEASGDVVIDEKGQRRVRWDNVRRAELRIDARKWLMQKICPKIYGDKITQEITGANGKQLIPQINITVNAPKEELRDAKVIEVDSKSERHSPQCKAPR